MMEIQVFQIIGYDYRDVNGCETYGKNMTATSIAMV